MDAGLIELVQQAAEGQVYDGFACGGHRDGQGWEFLGLGAILMHFYQDYYYYGAHCKTYLCFMGLNIVY